MIEKYSYDPFVLPYTIGLIYVLGYLFVALFRVIKSLDNRDRIKLLKLFFSTKIFVTLKDVFMDCLLHRKIWKKNKVLWYMHTSLAFGWFMLIVIGHIEVNFFCPSRLNLPYFPIFFRYFMMETDTTLKGSLLFFLMDFFLLIVLSGVFLAILKRFKRRTFGMKRTTRLKWNDQIAVISLWCIFPLRFLAESFTSSINGGGFLTRGFGMLFEGFNSFIANDAFVRPIWWAYSISLAVFFFALPESRFTHILSEVMLIFMRNAGIKPKNKNVGYSQVEIYSCSRCGLCIDVCPLANTSALRNKTTVNFIRSLRWWKKTEATSIANHCLMCNRCVEACPVGVNSVKLKLNHKFEHNNVDTKNNYDYLPPTNKHETVDVLYFAGCMTHLTPGIKKAMHHILDTAQVNYKDLDPNHSICCGRPIYLAGEMNNAQQLILANTKEIESYHPKVLITSCPICYTFFKQNYALKNIQILHHSQYILQLLDEGKIKVRKTALKFVFHDPCELGRNEKIYEEPRQALAYAGEVLVTEFDKENAPCCGESIAAQDLPYKKRKLMTEDAYKQLNATSPDHIITACPACKKAFNQVNNASVIDIAEIISKNIVGNF